MAARTAEYNYTSSDPLSAAVIVDSYSKLIVLHCVHERSFLSVKQPRTADCVSKIVTVNCVSAARHLPVK